MRSSLGNRRGFTLSELTVVIVVIGILALVAVPVFIGVRQSSLENAAVQNARLVNAARDSYALTIPGADEAWAAAPTDTARLALLVTENLLSGGPTDYLSMQGEYTLVLGSNLRSRTALLHDGAPVAY